MKLNFYAQGFLFLCWPHPCLHPVADKVVCLCSWVLLLCPRFLHLCYRFLFFMLSWPFFMLPRLSMGRVGRGRAESHRAGVLAPFSQQPGLTCCSATLTFCLCVCFRAYGARARWDCGEWSPLSCMGRVCLCWPACEPDLLIATLKRRLKRTLRDKTVSVFPAALSAA